MLNFKNIKRSIIKPNQHSASPIMHSKKSSQNSHMITFKTIKQYQECSPLNKNQLDEGFSQKFDTDKKKRVDKVNQFNMKSQSKENHPNIYYNRKNQPQQNDNYQLEFTRKKRKIVNGHNPTQAYEKSYENSASKKGHISFANLLSSKRVETNSKNKSYLQSDRKLQRQSSISKLKQKLFGAKKVISEKEKPKQFICKQYQTQRVFCNDFELSKNMQKGSYLNVADQDLVKISMRNDEGSSIQELDMVPYF